MKICSLLLLLTISVGLIGCGSGGPSTDAVTNDANALNKQAAGTTQAPPATNTGGDAPTAALGPKGIGGKH